MEWAELSFNPSIIHEKQHIVPVHLGVLRQHMTIDILTRIKSNGITWKRYSIIYFMNKKKLFEIKFVKRGQEILEIFKENIILGFRVICNLTNLKTLFWQNLLVSFEWENNIPYKSNNISSKDLNLIMKM